MVRLKWEYIWWGNPWVESLVHNISELVRLIFFLALETVIIVTILVWDKGKGKLIQRGKGTLKKITDIEKDGSRNFEKKKKRRKAVSSSVIMTRSLPGT